MNEGCNFCTFFDRKPTRRIFIGELSESTEEGKRDNQTLVEYFYEEFS